MIPCNFDLAAQSQKVSDNLQTAVAQRSNKPKKGDEPIGRQLDMLVAKAKDGNVAAFQELYHGYARKILNYVYRMTGSREDAEDLTQETFILAFKNLNSLKENGRFQSWLYRIAQNSVYQKYRAQTPQMESIENSDEDSRVLQLPSSGKTPEGTALSGELVNVIDTAIRELPEKYRQVFVLSALQNLSYEAIAEIVGRSLPSVKSDIHRARVEVREKVKQYLGNDYGLPSLSI